MVVVVVVVVVVVAVVGGGGVVVAVRVHCTRKPISYRISTMLPPRPETQDPKTPYGSFGFLGLWEGCAADRREFRNSPEGKWWRVERVVDEVEAACHRSGISAANRREFRNLPEGKQ